jgi:Asp-tRNA(Asn)/Glu-tRNA(Gln) amidotransferase A subunit family amidase
MADTDVAFSGPVQQAELVRAGEVSPRELVTLYLKRIAELDSKLNSFRVVRAERALAEAEEAERIRASGEERPLLGVPIAVKDTQDVAGEVTTLGTGCVDEPAREDSEVVKRLRAAGAIVIGKTNLPELAFAMFTESPTWGITRNPWDLTRVPGGSSGGSAAAVAAGLAAASTASDGAGSIRIPAAYCSLFGLKPQRGRVPMDPLVEHWYGLSVNGYVTRSVMDTAALLDVSAGGGLAPRKPGPPERPFVESASIPPGRLRICVSTRAARALAPPMLDDRCRAALEETAELLISLGHDVSWRDPDYRGIGNQISVLYMRGIADDARRPAASRASGQAHPPPGPAGRPVRRRHRSARPGGDREACRPGERDLRPLRRSPDPHDRGAARPRGPMGAKRRPANPGRDESPDRIHASLELPRKPRGVGARRFHSGGPAALRPADRPTGRRGDAALAGRPDRVRTAVGRTSPTDCIGTDTVRRAVIFETG